MPKSTTAFLALLILVALAAVLMIGPDDEGPTEALPRLVAVPRS